MLNVLAKGMINDSCINKGSAVFYTGGCQWWRRGLWWQKGLYKSHMTIGGGRHSEGTYFASYWFNWNPWWFKQFEQQKIHLLTWSCTFTTLNIMKMITHHDNILRMNSPVPANVKEGSRIWFGWCELTSERLQKK